MANTLIISADNIIIIDRLCIPNSNPVEFINNANITWKLYSNYNPTTQTGILLATGNYTYTSDSDGQYTTTIPASITSVLTENVQYQLNSNVIASGFTSLFSDVYTALSPPSLQFSYCSRVDIENIYGKTNVNKWADIDSDGNLQTIDSRINWALQLSYDVVNSKLEGGIYKTPLTGRYPLIISTQAQLAAVHLYESRGLTNFNENTGQMEHQLSQGKGWALKNLSAIRAGTIRVPGVLNSDIIGTNIPKAIRVSTYRHTPLIPW